MIRLTAAVLFVSLLSASPIVVAQTKSDAAHTNGAGASASVRGRVADPQNNAVTGALVILSSQTEVVARTRTNGRGEYSLGDLPGGAYRISATASGLVAEGRDVRLQTGETQNDDLAMTLSAVDQHVVVSSSLGEVLTTQSASSVTVIGEDEIANRDAQSVSDVLREVPGIAVADTGRRGGATGVFIRGGNSNYNLIMVDGMPLNQFGGDFDFAPLPTDGLDRIEVVRGAESSLYGSNAVTGVVNLITHRGDGAPSFTAVAEGGSYDTYRLATGGAGSMRGFHWSYDLTRLESNGVVQNDDYHNQSAFVSLGYSRGQRRQIDMHFFGNSNDAGVPGPFGSDPNGTFFGLDTVSRDKQNLFGYQASEAEQITSRWKQVSTVSVVTNRYYFVSPFGDTFAKNFRVVANTRAEVTLAPSDVLVAGFEYNREDFESTFVADANSDPFVLPRTSLAYFVENRWNPGHRWTVTAGLRVDDIRTRSLPADGFGERPFLPANSIVQANPRASVAYALRDGGAQTTWGATRLHGSVGTGIRPPNGFELGFTDNPHLKPEQSITTDVGVEQRLFEDRAVVDVTYFFNRFRNQIVTLGGSPQNLSSFSSDNLNNARAQGAELSLRAQPLRSLAVSAAYTRLNTQILALDGTTLAQTPFQVGQPLIRRPRNSGSYDVTWSRGRVRLNTNGYARGRMLDDDPSLGISCGSACLLPNPGYVLINAGFGVQTLHGVEVYGQLNNLLNRKYEEVLGYPAYRLNFMAGIRLRLSSERASKLTR